MINARVLRATVVSVAACFASAASAEVLVYEFSGTVTWPSYMSRIGDKVRGTFSYESGLVPTGCYTNGGGSTDRGCSYYDLNGSVRMTVGAHQITASKAHISVENDQGYEGFEDNVKLTWGSPVVVDGTTFQEGFAQAWLVTGKRQVLDAPVPPRHYQVRRYDSNRLAAVTNGNPIDGTFLQFSIDSIRLVPAGAQK